MNDYSLAKYKYENNEWIPLKQISLLNKLSIYNYETILNAICSKRSDIIELNLCESVCIRRRRRWHRSIKQSFIKENSDFYRTVIVNGLPRDAKYEELIEFFNHFYPVSKIKMFSFSSTINSFNFRFRIIKVKSLYN
mgnify:CR=1 FL=1